MEDEDAMIVLLGEFDGGSGTFLAALRPGLEWDRDLFTRLEQAMRTICAQTQNQDWLDRELAEGFHHTPRFVRDWSTNPVFPAPEPAEYHDACLNRLDDLADWFFFGRPPIQVWPDL
jgi:hypothetical protein